ncbi:hypothetical protein YC2023_035274 [Brassica napus]
MRVTGKKKVRASTTNKSDSPATNKKEEEGCVLVKSNQASLELRKRNNISTGPSSRKSYTGCIQSNANEIKKLVWL